MDKKVLSYVGITFIILCSCAVGLLGYFKSAPVPSSPSQTQSAVPDLPVACIVAPQSLGGAGYTFSPPGDIGVTDPNPPIPEFGILPMEPPYFLCLDLQDNSVMSLVSRPCLWGSFTVLQPVCGYGMMTSDSNLGFSMLQAFPTSELIQENAAVRFNSSVTESVYYSDFPYGTALPVAEIAKYKVYADDTITVYDFASLAETPPLEKQLEDWWTVNELDKLGLTYDWILEMRDYFLKEPGGVGRFIQPVDR